eukprot:CAMPEP_0173297536 /NCGR_PEP_ID=MMETSP1143-20121109/15587_1 /TAXON_ID=483371 /ORGANISM="non described non described, Strain CCMP2298" /LENGTH=51 /DNA_ID=CAMNT_0014237543 /DNA_START=98 /DNA_END=253 /DNA_ORIENTATION=+
MGAKARECVAAQPIASALQFCRSGGGGGGRHEDLTTLASIAAQLVEFGAER